jgi:hypothetical protein
VFENSRREILPNSQILTYLQSGVTFAYKFRRGGGNLLCIGTEAASCACSNSLFYRGFFCTEIAQQAHQNDAQQHCPAVLVAFLQTFAQRPAIKWPLLGA